MNLFNVHDQLEEIFELLAFPLASNFLTFTFMSTNNRLSAEIWEGFLREYPEVGTGALSMEEINQRMTKYVARRNAAPQSDFEGLSSAQMHALMTDPFGTESPLGWVADQNEKAVLQVPLLALLDLLMAEIQRSGEVKLTAKGNLPVSLCTLLVEQESIELRYWWMGRGKATEDKIPYLWPLKFFLLDENLAKKRHQKLSLTKKGHAFMQLSSSARLRVFMTYFTERFHWGNLYNLDDNGHFGQAGLWYSLWLLMKFGDKSREASFYLEKWGKVFNRSGEPLRGEYAYFIRFFDSFCRWFGLAQTEERITHEPFKSENLVKKSELLGKIFSAG